MPGLQLLPFENYQGKTNREGGGLKLPYPPPTQIRLNVHAPLQNKHLIANHATFLTKELQKAVMKRTKLRNA